MAWDVSPDPLDFEEAIAWFKSREVVSNDEFDALSARAKRKAFTVANVAQLDIVNQAWEAVDKAISKGTTLEDFKRDIADELEKAWGGTVDDPAWRLETIFRTNVQASYGAGRYEQATDPAVLDDRPVWMFDAVLDGRTTKVCRACDGTKLPASHPWWKSHVSPLHFNCRSTFTALTEEEAGKLTARPPKEQASDGFGLPPDESEWEPDTEKYPEELEVELSKKLSHEPE